MLEDARGPDHLFDAEGDAGANVSEDGGRAAFFTLVEPAHVVDGCTLERRDEVDGATTGTLGAARAEEVAVRQQQTRALGATDELVRREERRVDALRFIGGCRSMGMYGPPAA